ncbi:MAG: T9SS type A sorting domain-containing protein [Flavobacteriia bacterium]|nr:T9SS type A sorting domain-containing protein [Flavobacteriia bacterium]
MYTTGLFYSTVDFDPSAGTNNLSAVSGSDIWYQKLGPGFNSLEEHNSGLFTLSPNPSTGVYQLSAKKAFHQLNLVVTDASGKVVYRAQNLSGIATEIDLSFLKSGLYIATLSDGTNDEVIRLIKE